MILKIYRSFAKQLQSFENRFEMNEHIKTHIHFAGRKLYKNAKAVLGMITRHSVVVTGVSWLNEETIAKNLGICTRTVFRAVERLESLGIGKCISVEFEGYTLNYFVLCKFNMSADCTESVSSLSLDETNRKPTETRGEAISKMDEHLEISETKEKDIKTIRINVADETQSLDASFTPTSVPTAFVSVIQRFYNSAQYIYKLWQKALLAHSKTGLNSPIEQQIDKIIAAFKQSIFAFKTKRIKGDFIGYFYGTLSAIFCVEKRKEVNYVPSWAM